MKKYLDSKKGIYTDGYNHYVIDLGVYKFLTDSTTIDNADELIGILTKLHAHGGQLSGDLSSASAIAMYSVNNLDLVRADKTLHLVITSYSALSGSVVFFVTCTYLTGTWTVSLETATTAWDT